MSSTFLKLPNTFEICPICKNDLKYKEEQGELILYCDILNKFKNNSCVPHLECEYYISYNPLISATLDSKNYSTTNFTYLRFQIGEMEYFSSIHEIAIYFGKIGCDEFKEYKFDNLYNLEKYLQEIIKT